MVYLDNAATAKPNPKVLEQVMPYLTEYYGNPSSSYNFGRICKDKIEETRQIVADYIGGDAENVYFTPSSSASNNAAIQSMIRDGIWMCPSKIEHIDILECCKALDICNPIKVNKNGIINLYDLSLSLDNPGTNAFIVGLVNNELGVIQDISLIEKTVHKYNDILMVDATQAITKVPINVKDMGIDILTFGSHKIGGLRGCGVLYSTLPLHHLVYGHQGIVSGTENTPAIVSIGAALQLEHDNKKIVQLRDYFEDELLREIPDCYINCQNAKRAPHISNICIKGCDAETVQMMLDMDDICVSTGSACNSHEQKASHVLEAIGLTEPDLYSCLRLSFSEDNTYQEIDYAIDKLKKNVEFLRNM